MVFRYFILIICLALGSYGASLYNGDFEFGRLSQYEDFNEPEGWICENYAAVMSNFVPYPEQGNTSNWQIDLETGLTPLYGESFVVLSTGDVYPDPTYAAIKQQIMVEEGWTFSGYYFFGTCDYSPFSDFATIKMVPSDSNIPRREIILVDIAVEDPNIGDYGSMADWEYFEYTFDANETGTYDLIMRVDDRQDAIFKTYLAVDHLRLECKYGDINNDCIVNMVDYSILIDEWGIDCSDPEIDCSPIDLDEDGWIGLSDLLVLSDFWLNGPP